jgi:glycosyltransferase involved in cell wall biosynthesis
MEIIHLVVGNANTERMDGVNKAVHDMATNQLKNNYQVQVWGITSNTVNDYPERIFTTQLFKGHKNPFKANKQLLADLYEKKDSIVVHFHGAFLPVFYTISKYLQRNKIPFIITPYSTYDKVMMKKNALIKKIYFQLFEKKLLNRAHTIHLLGKTEWEGLQAIYHNKKSRLIPYGFKNPQVNPKQQEKASVFTIGYCGSITIYPKGLDLLLKGFSLFHQICPKAELIIIGDGKDSLKLEKIASDLKISNKVRFKGCNLAEEKLKTLIGCHVFAHPSRTEGYPAAILEAASLGLPCIVSRATNTENFILQFDAGYTMKDLNPDSVCKGLTRIYDRITICKESEILGQNALRMIDGAFNWLDLLLEFNSIYKDAFFNKKTGITKKILQRKNELVA